MSSQYLIGKKNREKSIEREEMRLSSFYHMIKKEGRGHANEPTNKKKRIKLTVT
jgi:hypothetical protein